MNNLTITSIAFCFLATGLFILGMFLYWWSNTITGLASACIIVAILLFFMAILLLSVSYGSYETYGRIE